MTAIAPTTIALPWRILRRARVRLRPLAGPLHACASMWFCTEQVVHVAQATKGLPAVMPVVTLALMSTKAALLILAIRAAVQAGKPTGLLQWNLITAIIFAIGNMVMLVYLTRSDEQLLDQDATLMVLLLWACGLALALSRWRRCPGQLRLVRLGTALGIAPYAQQALNYVVFGSVGASWFNLILLWLICAGVFFVTLWPSDLEVVGHARDRALAEGRFALFILNRRDLIGHSLVIAACLVGGAWRFSVWA